MRETGLQRYVVDEIRLGGDYAVVICPPVQAGTPDVLACIGGLFVGIETKVGRNQPSPIQEHRLNQIKEANGIAVVIRSRKEFRELRSALKSSKPSEEFHGSDISGT